MKTKIIYWSGTGNTEEMANLIDKGAKNKGLETEIMPVNEADANEVGDCDLLVLGCPSMGDEILEEEEFEPFFSKIEGFIAGKKLALFGSYDWGDGQWMRSWTERARKAGAEIVADSLTVNLAPQGDEKQRCLDFGESLASVSV